MTEQDLSERQQVMVDYEKFLELQIEAADQRLQKARLEAQLSERTLRDLIEKRDEVHKSNQPSDEREDHDAR